MTIETNTEYKTVEVEEEEIVCNSCKSVIDDESAVEFAPVGRIKEPAILHLCANCLNADGGPPAVSAELDPGSGVINITEEPTYLFSPYFTVKEELSGTISVQLATFFFIVVIFPVGLMIELDSENGSFATALGFAVGGLLWGIALFLGAFGQSVGV